MPAITARSSSSRTCNNLVKGRPGAIRAHEKRRKYLSFYSAAPSSWGSDSFAWTVSQEIRNALTPKTKRSRGSSSVQKSHHDCMALREQRRQHRRRHQASLGDHVMETARDFKLPHNPFHSLSEIHSPPSTYAQPSSPQEPNGQLRQDEVKPSRQNVIIKSQRPTASDKMISAMITHCLDINQAGYGLRMPRPDVDPESGNMMGTIQPITVLIGPQNPIPLTLTTNASFYLPGMANSMPNSTASETILHKYRSCRQAPGTEPHESDQNDSIECQHDHECEYNNAQDVQAFQWFIIRPEDPSETSSSSADESHCSEFDCHNELSLDSSIGFDAEEELFMSPTGTSTEEFTWMGGDWTMVDDEVPYNWGPPIPPVSLENVT